MKFNRFWEIIDIYAVLFKLTKSSNKNSYLSLLQLSFLIVKMNFAEAIGYQ